MYIIIAIIILIIIYILFEYNSFIKNNNALEEAFSTMDVYLKKRFDLIPNFVETVKAYAKYESETLAKIVESRNQRYDGMTLHDKINMNEQISKELFNVISVVENYPDLKASESFSELMKQLTAVENDIANARKYYNAVVKKVNIKIEMFPSNLVANIFKFKKAEMFKITEKEKENIKVEN